MCDTFCCIMAILHQSPKNVHKISATTFYYLLFTVYILLTDLSSLLMVFSTGILRFSFIYFLFTNPSCDSLPVQTRVEPVISSSTVSTSTQLSKLFQAYADCRQAFSPSSWRQEQVTIKVFNVASFSV